MGVGGLLAAIAGGTGVGMLKISEQAWKEAEKQKEMEFRLKFQENDHKHAKALQDDRYKQETRLATHKSNLALAAERAKQKMQDPTGYGKQIEDLMQSIQTYSTQIANLDKQIQDMGSAGLTPPPEMTKERERLLALKLDAMNRSAPLIHQYAGEKEKSWLNAQGYNGDWGITPPNNPAQATQPVGGRELPKEMDDATLTSTTPRKPQSWESLQLTDFIKTPFDYVQDAGFKLGSMAGKGILEAFRQKHKENPENPVDEGYHW